MKVLESFKLANIHKTLVFTLGFFFCFFASINIAYAGFGISPPELKSDKLYPGSQYEQLIMLLRSSAEEDLVAQVSVSAPEIESWISIDKGNEFTLPKGSLQIPMVVRVSVPEGAEVGNYQGHINVRISPKNEEKEAGVAIALGARVEIKLVVTKEQFIDFKVRLAEIPDIEKLNKPWSWKIFSWFFYRIKVVMKIENLGNVPVAPSKVTLEVRDILEKDLLESSEDTKIEKVAPFQTERNVMATFPTQLDVGHYWGLFKIYKDQEIVYKEKLPFAVVAPGKLGGTDLGIWPNIIIGATIVLCLLVIFILIKIKIWLILYKLLLIIIWPFHYLGKWTFRLYRKIKINFWKWMHRKSAKYQQEEEMNNEIQEDMDDEKED
ncbi:hypothetical protein ACFLZ9_00190 [Patescibacteria group bacterium]